MCVLPVPGDVDEPKNYDLPPKKRTTELSMIPEVEPRKDSANETRSSFL